MADLKEVCKKGLVEMDERNVFWCNPFSRMHCNVWLVRALLIWKKSEAFRRNGNAVLLTLIILQSGTDWREYFTCQMFRWLEWLWWQHLMISSAFSSWYVILSTQSMKFHVMNMFPVRSRCLTQLLMNFLLTIVTSSVFCIVTFALWSGKNNWESMISSKMKLVGLSLYWNTTQ